MNNPVVFLNEVRDELQKVTWPTRAEVIRLTIVVLIVSTIVGLFIGGVDLVLTRALEVLLRV